MFKLTRLLSILFIISTFYSFAQKNATKFKNFEGDAALSFLSGDSLINLQFFYGKLKIRSSYGSANTEKEESVFVKEVVDRLNEVEPGKGGKWSLNWVTYRKEFFEPEFENHLLEVLKEKKLALRTNNEKGLQKYTLLVYTYMMDPGWNIGIHYNTPICYYQIIFCETISRKVMANWSFATHNWTQNTNTASKDFDQHTQFMLPCYKYAGKAVGEYMVKKLKK